MTKSVDQLAEFGFTIIERFLPSSVVEPLIHACNELPNAVATRYRMGKAFARRNLLEIPSVRVLSKSKELTAIIETLLGACAIPVRGILFDKTPDANWVVPWHQDLSIAVKERIDTPGFGPWSTKAGVAHVQPPIEILQHMLTVRIHLDDCGSDNGPLRVIPNTHQQILSPDELSRRVEQGPQIDCCVDAGGIAAMRPLILHGSLPARRPHRRRVVHIEYAACNLPNGLEWNIIQWHDQDFDLGGLRHG